MGIFDRFRRQTAVDSYSINNGDFYGAWKLSNEDYLRIMGLSPSEMWRTQPYLRIVVTFMARNIAQLGLHTFERVSEDNRRRVRDGALAAAIAKPNRASTSFELIYGLVADLALHDRAFWLTSDDPAQQITRLPVDWVTAKGGDALEPAYYDVRVNDKGESVKIPAEQILAFHGWHPAALYGGSSPINALQEILAEQVQASKYREAVWRRGGKVGAVLSRPADAPAWSDAAREQFKADYESNFTGSGPRVGGTPLLEDGMTLNRVDFSAHEMQFIEGSRLALNTCASVYHINPTMIGLLDNANYSNVREFRKMLYGDTLGPVIAQIEDRINTFLVPRLDSRPNLYVEFNIDEKLQGNFEEQTAALQSSVGRPWMTANEARALRNMPAIADGDGLVTPLNVLVGGQASLTDSAPPKLGIARVKVLPSTHGFGAGLIKADPYLLLKARVTEQQTKKVAEILARFFDRQSKVVLSAIGAGGKWWTESRWNSELADDLHRVAASVTDALGKSEAESLGFDSGDYDPDLTVNYLRAVAERYANNINLTTKKQLDAEVDDPDGDPSLVFAKAREQRADGGSVAVTTYLAGFAAFEAAKQLASSYDLKPTKTWVTGSNPRKSHAALNGDTVALSDNFANGMAWPGDAGRVDDVAGCNCSLQINLP